MSTLFTSENKSLSSQTSSVASSDTVLSAKAQAQAQAQPGIVLKKVYRKK